MTEIKLVGKISFVKSSEEEETAIVTKLETAGFIAARGEGEIWFIRVV